MSQPLEAPADPSAAPPPEFVLTGDLARPARLTVAGLLAWPQHTRRVAFDPARRKDRPRFLIAVRGADGHHALLSWAEVDPDFGRAPVLLAATLDGTPLDRSSLVLPQDRCGARYISGIETIRVYGGHVPTS